MKIKKEKQQFKTFDISVKQNSVDKENFTAEFILSTDSPDRHGDIIDQESWVLDNFLKAPRLLLQHNSHQFPIGKWEKLWIEQDGDVKMLVGRAKFAYKEYDQAKTAFDLVAGGFLNTVSVGFRWGRYEEDPETGIITFFDNELLECSLVSIPANPDALLKSNDKEDIAKAIEDATKAIEKVEEEIDNDIEKGYKVNHKLKAKHYLFKALRSLKK